MFAFLSPKQIEVPMTLEVLKKVIFLYNANFIFYHISEEFKSRKFYYCKFHKFKWTTQTVFLPKFNCHWLGALYRRQILPMPMHPRMTRLKPWWTKLPKTMMLPSMFPHGLLHVLLIYIDYYRITYMLVNSGKLFRAKTSLAYSLFVLSKDNAGQGR